MKIISENHIVISFDDLNTEWNYMNFQNQKDDLSIDYTRYAQYMINKYGDKREIKTCEFDRVHDVFNLYF